MEVERIKGTKYNKEYKKIKVCAYARVSTDLEKQDNSFESQLIYYEHKIKNNPNWEFVGIYSDKGISGLSTEKREGFKEMLKDAYNGKIDLILTKSISRFSRNTLDILKVIRELKEKNIYIYFEEEMISTDSLDSELILTALSSVAQMESELISSRIRKTFKMNREMNRPIVYRDYLGYRHRNGQLLINKREAKVVEEIFNRVLNNETFGSIAKDLKERGIKNTKYGNKWFPSTIKRIVRNRIYIGEYSLYVDRWRHENLTDGKWFISVFEDHHKPIVSKELFDRANEYIDKLEEVQTINKVDNPFNSKVFCGFCNSRFTKRFFNKKREKRYWKCNPNYYSGKKCEVEGYIPEELLILSFVKLIKKINRIKIKDIKSRNEEKELIEKKFNKKMQEYNRLIDLYFEKEINNYLYNLKKKNLELELDTIRNELNIIDDYEKENKDRNEVFNYIKNVLKYYNIKEFNEDLFELLIKKIIVGGLTPKGYRDKYLMRFIVNPNFIENDNNENEVILELKVKYKLRYCADHTIKTRYSFNVKLELEKNERYK